MNTPNTPQNHTETNTDSETVAAPSRPRRRSRRGLRMARLIAALVAIAVLAAACGGADVADVTAGDGSSRPADNGGASGSDGSAGGDGSAVTTASAAAAQCPAPQAMFDLINRATYQVFGEFIVAGEAEPRYIPVGTAWGLDDRVLVTNAHVAEFYTDVAAGGLQLSRAVAVQAGTGEVVELLRAVVHPDYTGDPLGSPDVAVFTTKEAIPSVLTLGPDTVEVEVGDEILLSGFPGDVEDVLPAIPGLTVPQATSLTGRVTSLRSHDLTEVVTDDNVDVLQHQAPTTPGTSGSAIVICDEVVAVHNAGTVRFVVSPGPDGSQNVERQAQASNNFGVHVRHIRALMTLFDDNAIQGFALPVAAESQAPDGGSMAPADDAAEPLLVGGAVTDPAAAHEFVIQINPDGTIEGISEWPETGQFTLTGQVNADGTVVFVDDAPERLGFRRGTYEGVITSDTTIEGVYYEQSQEQNTWGWTAIVL